MSTFLQEYPRLAIEAEHSPQPARTLTRVASEAPEAQPSAGLVASSTGSRTTVFQDIAQAHREIYALYEIAQALGSSLGVTDTMALISGKMSHIIPLSSCALFLCTKDNDGLTCEFSSGDDSERLQHMEIGRAHV